MAETPSGDAITIHKCLLSSLTSLQGFIFYFILFFDRRTKGKCPGLDLAALFSFVKIIYIGQSC